VRNHDLMVEHGPGTWDDDFTFLIRFFLSNLALHFSLLWHLKAF
jgi:hypothetical protein